MSENDPTERLAGDSQEASADSAIEDVAGAPTWPIQAPGSSEPPPPPVGLSWSSVSQRLGIDLRLLQHDGIIVLAGDYFPESGYFFRPDTLDAQHVDVGDVAMQHGYFLGNITARDFAEWYPLSPGTQRPAGLPVIRRETGPIIGLFSNRRSAQKALSAVLQGSLGSGIRLEDGPLGSELSVLRPEEAGAVATVMAAHGGAVISIAGRPTAGQSHQGPASTAPSMAASEGDSWRPGTGAASDSQAPSLEVGGSEEFAPPSVETGGVEDFPRL